MATVGVIIGRFQADVPHKGHTALIHAVHKKHAKVLICLGCAPVRLAATDPLDYATRFSMMKRYFPWATIVPLHDQPTNKLWSKNLDTLIEEIFPTDMAILYGSRKSFAPCYSGKWQVCELPDVEAPSATELRRRIAHTVRDSADFRAGVIYAAANRFSHSYPVVDVGVVRNINGGAGHRTEYEVLLCRKDTDPKNERRFIGGFYNPADANYEESAKREVKEETTNVDISNLHYLCSMPIDDWRYRGRGDGIITTFFRAKYESGNAIAGDDIDEVRWFPAEIVPGILMKSHQALGTMLIENLKKGDVI